MFELETFVDKLKDENTLYFILRTMTGKTQYLYMF